jgi:hypothetical protein
LATVVGMLVATAVGAPPAAAAVDGAAAAGAVGAALPPHPITKAANAIAVATAKRVDFAISTPPYQVE